MTNITVAPKKMLDPASAEDRAIGAARMWRGQIAAFDYSDVPKDQIQEVFDLVQREVWDVAFGRSL